MIRAFLVVALAAPVGVCAPEEDPPPSEEDDVTTCEEDEEAFGCHILEDGGSEEPTVDVP